MAKKDALAQEQEHEQEQEQEQEQAQEQPETIVDVTKTMVKIMLARARPGEEKHIMVGYNGKNYQIKKGEEVEVPYGVAEIIKNAYIAEDERYAYEEMMEKRAKMF